MEHRTGRDVCVQCGDYMCKDTHGVCSCTLFCCAFIQPCKNIWSVVSKHGHMLARNTHTHRTTMVMWKGSSRSCPQIVAMSCQWTSSRCDYKILFVSDSVIYSPVVININVDRFSDNV